MFPSELITKVKKRLGGNTLPQSPSPAQIIERGIDEYQNATVKGNNTGNAWAVKEFVLDTSAEQRRYEIIAPDFSKALAVSTVPTSNFGERTLEFTQLEQLPNDWSWLSSSNGWFGLFGGNWGGAAFYAAFFRLVAADGFKNYMEIRPTPAGVEQYRILYQVGDWSLNIGSDLNFKFPYSDLNFYFVALVANGLLPYCKWTNDAQQDLRTAQMLKAGILEDLARYQQTFDDFIASLSVTRAVYGESYADSLGL